MGQQWVASPEAEYGSPMTRTLARGKSNHLRFSPRVDLSITGKFQAAKDRRRARALLTNGSICGPKELVFSLRLVAITLSAITLPPGLSSISSCSPAEH